MPSRKWIILMVPSMAALWAIVYVTKDVHDSSIQGISRVVTMFAIAGTLSLALIAWWAVTGRAPRGRAIDSSFRGKAAVPSLTEPLTVPLNAEADRLNAVSTRFNTLAGAGVAIAAIGYFPVARYFQILTPIRLWIVVVLLSAAGAVLIHVRYMRRLLPQIVKRSNRVGRAAVPSLIMVPCFAIALRLLNASADLVLPPQTKSGTVAHTSVWGGRHSWASHFVDVQIDAGESVSLSVSGLDFRKFEVGTRVNLQARDGLLGMPWCLNDCLTPVQTTPLWPPP
jgi:hypothetical protein